MTVQNPLEFIPLSESVDEGSRGREVRWITSWWKDRTEASWGGISLKKLASDDWFQLHTQYRPRLWTPPQAAIGTLVELFNEDFLAQPNIPHLFSIPRFMTHLWINKLSKDTDVLFTINVEPYFWPCPIYEPLIVLIVLFLAHFSNYRGPWVLRGSSQYLEVQDHLEAGLKYLELHGCRKFHDLEGPVHGVQDPKEEWIRALLFKFTEAQKTFPHMLYGLVRRILPPSPGGPFLSTYKYCRRRLRKTWSIPRCPLWSHSMVHIEKILLCRNSTN